MKPPRSIGLFGGTFDPVHLGHLHLAAVAREALNLNQVRFIPCQISPHKTGHAPTPPADRLELLKIATRGLPWAMVDDREINRTGPSFSYQTADSLAAEFPDATLFWILGGDQWEALPRWKNAEHLAKIVDFIILARGGETPEPRNGYRHHLVPGSHPASATAIRAAFAAGATDHPWLPPGVAETIRARRLYRSV